MWHLIRTILLLIPRIIWDYFTWILSYNKKIDKIPLEKRYNKVRSIISVADKRLKIDMHVEGKENIPEEASCFFANHLSATDPIIYFPLFEKPVAFLGKVEIQKYPVVGKLLTIGGGLFLKRDDLKQQLKIMMKVQDSLRNAETNWFIFPEGTRNKDQMQNIPAFHHGTFRAAMKAGVPIVPVVNYGTFRLLDTSHSLKSYPVTVKFLSPIRKEEYEGLTTEQVAEIVHSRIQKELTYNIRKLDNDRMLKLHDKKYRFNKLY